jgi:hypothetical protein
MELSAFRKHLLGISAMPEIAGPTYRPSMREASLEEAVGGVQAAITAIIGGTGTAQGPSGRSDRRHLGSDDPAHSRG